MTARLSGVRIPLPPPRSVYMNVAPPFSIDFTQQINHTKNIMRHLSRVFLRCLSFLLIFFLLIPIFTSVTHAQTQTVSPAAYQFAAPNLDPDVPQNQHTFIQSLFLETLLTIDCQLSGIDFANPTKSCLGLDLKTGKLGYAPSDPSQQGNLPIGGLLGIATQGISAMYTPTFGSHEYFNYLSDNFGIAKQAHAAPYTGFQGLAPVLSLWKTTRDIAYYLLIIAFIFIGIGVMLRLKIDPRTVMTIQNQIPRVIICIILITFSYAFAGLLIDAMWTVTYMGVNKITEASNPDTGGGVHLDSRATHDLLSTPFGFVNDIFQSPGGAGGIINIGWGVGQAIGKIETSVIVSLFFGGSNVTTGCVEKTLGIPTGLNLGGCVQGIISDIIGFLWFFIIAVVLLITLFRIWFELLKAYIMVLMYVILAPIWIVFGLLPKRPLGFERWLRVFFANLAVFPATVLLLIGARVLHELFNNPNVLGASTVRDVPAVLQATAQYHFVPPLVGNPNANSFGSILEFGMLLMAPQILNIIREKIGAPQLKQFGQAVQTFNAGRAAAAAPAKQTWKHLNARDQQGNAIGFVAGMRDRGTKAVVEKVSNMGAVGRYVASTHDKKEYAKQNYGSVTGYDKSKEDYKAARDNWAQQYNPKTRRLFASQEEFDKRYKGRVAMWQAENGPRATPPPNIPPQPGATAGAAGTPQPGAGGAPATPAINIPASAPGAVPETGGQHLLTVRVVGPEGQEEKPINLAEPGSAHEVVMRNVRNIQTVSEAQKDNLANAIEAERAAGVTHWDRPGSELNDEERSKVQEVVNRHINPTVGPEPTRDFGDTT